MDHDELLAAAKAAPAKVKLEEYRDVVQELRGKGFTWRDIADFLTERGVTTDHTRVYRTFGKQPKREVRSRPVEISRVTYLGERKTKKGMGWNLLEIELPSTLGQPIPVMGFLPGTSGVALDLGPENAVALRNATLVVKSGKTFPMAYVSAELRMTGGQWSSHEVYIAPRWEALLGGEVDDRNILDRSS